MVRRHRYVKLCRLYDADPYTCVSLSYCGWCQAKKVCVPGTFYGPLYKSYCGPNDYYVYDVPLAYSGINKTIVKNNFLPNY